MSLNEFFLSQKIKGIKMEAGIDEKLHKNIKKPSKRKKQIED